MIEFNERFYADGSMSATLRAPDLPHGMSYNVHLLPDGRCVSKSRGYGNGSVRYYNHQSYEQALIHGCQWAKRRIAQARRIRRQNSKAIDAVVEAIKADLRAA